MQYIPDLCSVDVQYQYDSEAPELILVLVLFLILGLLVQCAVRLVLTVPLSVSCQLVTLQRLLQVQWEQWE